MNTTSKFAIVCLAAGSVGLVGTVVMQYATIDRLRQENSSLQQQVERLSAQSNRFAAEKTDLSKLIAAQPVQATQSPGQEQSSEVLRLRGEVGRMRLEVRESEESRRAEMQAAQNKIAEAETNLARLTKMHAVGAVSEPELSHAQFAVQLLKAEANGDKPLAARIRLQEAEKDLARATKMHAVGAISEPELSHAQFAVQLLKAEANGDKPLAARIRLQEAEQDLARATQMRNADAISQSEYDEAARKVESFRTGMN
jgi:multidrug resistance efflux pump